MSKVHSARAKLQSTNYFLPLGGNVLEVRMQIELMNVSGKKLLGVAPQAPGN
jgi:hypothetical protein